MSDMSMRDCFAMNATEEDIEEHTYGGLVEVVTQDSNGKKTISSRRIKRSREAARYMYADAMLEARKDKTK